MKYRKLFSIAVISSALVGIGVAQASDIVIDNEIVESPVNVGDSTLISVSLGNITGSEIKNVDLRLFSGANVIGNGVVQLGSIANDATNIGMVDVVATTVDGNLPESLTWQLDYDDANGAHHQFQIDATLSEREAGQ